MNRTRVDIRMIAGLLVLACDGPSGPSGSPDLQLSATSHDFGPVGVGTLSGAHSFTVTNAGNESNPLAVGLSGPAAGQFVVSEDQCTGRALALHQSCQLQVKFQPTSSGFMEASVAVSAGAGEGVSAALRGSGASGVSIANRSIRFAATKVGDQSAAQGLTVRNITSTATGALTVELAGAHASDFELLGDGCTGQLLPGATSCVLELRFRPTAPGTRSATMRVFASPGGEVTASIEGVSGLPTSVVITPDTRDFGSVPVGASSEPVAEFTITNTGAGPTGTMLIAVTGPNQVEFPFLGNSCQGFLAPGASCTVQLSFNPIANGVRTAVLQVVEPYSDGASATLSGAAGTVELSLAPTSQEYRAMAGTSSEPQTFTVTNTGNIASGPVAASVYHCDYYDYYCDAVEFDIVEDDCAGVSLAPQQACTITVAFTPTVLGTHWGTLSVLAGPSSAFASLVGYPSGLQTLVTSVTFPATPAGLASATQTITVYNASDPVTSQSTGPLSVDLQGAEFEVTADDCTGAALQPLGSCTISVRFVPSAPGVQSGSITVSATPGGTESVTLLGEGT